MKKCIIFSIIIFLIIVGTLSVTAFQIQNKIISKEYPRSFTKAICTENNFCQDYEISCIRNNLISKTPITGASAQFSEDWQDPRSKEEMNINCE